MTKGVMNEWAIEAREMRRGDLTKGETATIGKEMLKGALVPGIPPRRRKNAVRTAIAIPIRYLRLANKLRCEGKYPGSAELTAPMGREKPQQAELKSFEREDIEASEDADVRRLEKIDRAGGLP